MGINLIDAGNGATTNGFNFNITGTTKISIAVEASTNLAEGIWTPQEWLSERTVAEAVAPSLQKIRRLRGRLSFSNDWNL